MMHGVATASTLAATSDPKVETRAALGTLWMPLLSSLNKCPARLPTIYEYQIVLKMRAIHRLQQGQPI